MAESVIDRAVALRRAGSLAPSQTLLAPVLEAAERCGALCGLVSTLRCLGRYAVAEGYFSELATTPDIAQYKQAISLYAADLDRKW
jgi:hypothetical protein